MYSVRQGLAVAFLLLGFVFHSEAIVAGAVDAVSSGTQPVLTVRVVDEAGRPVENAEAAAVKGEQKSFHTTFPSWNPVAGGLATFASDDLCSPPLGQKPEGMYLVAARARGYASRIVKVELPTTSPETLVTLRRGRRIELLLKPPAGRAIPPGLTPRTTSADLAPAAWVELGGRAAPHRGQVNLTPMESLGDGRYAFHVDDDSPDLYLMIDHPGFLRAYQSDAPFSRDDLARGRIEVQLPEPATVTVKFRAEDVAISGPATLSAKIRQKMPKLGGWLLNVASLPFDLAKGELTLPDLTPGAYYFQLVTADVDSDSQGGEFQSGRPETVELTALSVIAPLEVVDEEGTPVAGVEGFITGMEGSHASGLSWKASANGVLRFRQTDVLSRMPGGPEETEYRVHLRAPGFASRMVTVGTGKPGIAAQRVKLEKGRRVELVVVPPEGRSVPAGLRPVIAPADSLAHAWRYLGPAAAAPENQDRVFSTVVPEDLGNGRFAFHVADDTPELYVLLESPGFVRQFEAGPFTKEQLASGRIEAKVPVTGQIVITLKTPDDTTTAPGPKPGDAGFEGSFNIFVSRQVKGRGGNATVHVESMTTRKTTVFDMPDLAAGSYNVQAGPFSRAGEGRASEQVEVVAGSTATVTLRPGRATETPRMPGFGSDAPMDGFPEIRIVDEQGAPVRDAELLVRKVGTQLLDAEWTKVAGGAHRVRQSDVTVMWRQEKIQGRYRVVARAPGYAPATIDIDHPTSAASASVRLTRGRQVKLALKTADGREVPGPLLPSVFGEAWGVQAWITAQAPDPEFGRRKKELFGIHPVEMTTTGSYVTNLDPASTESLYVLVNHPGFLRGYEAGPFAPGDWIASGTLELILPAPGLLRASFGPPPGMAEADIPYRAASIIAYRNHKAPGAGNWSLRMFQDSARRTSITLEAADLAPGEYSVEGFTGALRERHVDGLRAFKGRQRITLDAGSSQSVAIVYAPFDESKLKGPYTAIIKVTGQDGKPAAGKPYKVMWDSSDHGTRTVAEGSVPESGTVEVKGLGGGIDKPTMRKDLKQDEYPPSYEVVVDGERLGYLVFYERKDDEMLPLPGGAKSKTWEFRIPPRAGDMAPDVEFVDVATSTPVRLSDFRGQAVLLDFWATWCGPCQGPMDSNQDMMARRARDWKGKATVIAASIDDDMETVKKHIAKKGWTAVRNVWCPPMPGSDGGWDAAAAKTYGINGVPTLLLIDPAGRIVRRGHIGAVEAENQLDQLGNVTGKP